MRRTIFVLAVVLALLSLGFAPPDTANGQSAPPSFTLPDRAQEVARGVFFLGTALDNGRVVEGYAYARLADVPPPQSGRGNAKPPWAGGPGGSGGEEEGGSGSSSCYSYIANGAKWRGTPEDYLLDPYGIGGPSGVNTSEFHAAMESWESAAGGGADIIGSRQPGDSDMSADTSRTDGRNEIYFASIADANVLGYTIVWSTRGGPPRNRAIVEADMVIDPDWDWYLGHEGDPPPPEMASQMHFWGVVVHEAGHYVGLGHTEGSECAEQTMYPYISAGDDSRESQGDGDIAGVNSLY